MMRELGHDDVVVVGSMSRLGGSSSSEVTVSIVDIL